MEEIQLKPEQIKHLYIQFFMKNIAVTDDQLNRLLAEYKKLLPNDDDSNVLDKRNLFDGTNKILRNVGFSLKTWHDEEHVGQTYHVLINEQNDKLANEVVWSEDEHKLYFSLVDKIVESSRSENQHGPLSIRINQAYNLTLKTNNKFNMTTGEVLINNWIQERWFKKMVNNNDLSVQLIGLGPRTICQNSTYLAQKFRFPQCGFCDLVLLFRGRYCSRCKKFIHPGCCSENSCPNCFYQLSELKTINY